MKTQTYEQALKILERFDERPVTKKIVPISSSASPAPVVNSTKSLTSAGRLIKKKSDENNEERKIHIQRVCGNLVKLLI